MADLTSPFILLMIATERADINHLVLVYLFITLFVYQVPLPIASKIVECFILDGEIALVKILLRMLYVKRETIMRLQECELLSYLRSGMTSECCTEMEIG